MSNRLSLFARVSGSPTVLVGLLVVLLIGCGVETPVAPERTWEEVRYGWSGSEPNDTSGEILIRASGEMEWSVRGRGTSNRGLLAGENLENLTRLIGALPPADFHGAPECAQQFRIEATVAGKRHTYEGGNCDPAVPPGVASLINLLEGWIRSSWTYRQDPVDYRILAAGAQSRVANETRYRIRSRDELLRAMDRLGENAPQILPAVDFSRQIILAIFLGERVAEQVTIAGALRTEGGQVVVREVWETAPIDCQGIAPTARPYALVALATSGDVDLLIEAERFQGECRAAGDTSP